VTEPEARATLHEQEFARKEATLMSTPFQVVFDCADPDRLAHFWAEALHYKLQDPPEGYASWEDFLKATNLPEERWNDASAVVDPEGIKPRIYFQRVPEGKVVKNRVHLDLNVGGGHDAPPEERRSSILAEVDRLKALGATTMKPGDEPGATNEFGEFWVVMRDPGGNEFCLQ
jgi:Glyoxalase-like domain